MGLRGPQAVTSRDWTSHEGARALADAIEQYWAKRGYPHVRAEVVLMGCVAKVNGSPIYGVKTNLGPGGEPLPAIAA